MRFIGDAMSQLGRVEQLEIINLVYPQICKEIAEFRTTAFRATVLYSTFCIAALAYLFSREAPVKRPTALIVIAGVLVLAVFATLFLRRLHTYFNEGARVVKKCEVLMGCHDAEVIEVRNATAFKWNESTLMPENWKGFGNPDWWEPLFSFSFWLVWLLSLATVISYVGLSFS